MKNETETSNQQLILVLAAFSFHILICMFFFLIQMLLCSGGPNCSANSQTSFLQGSDKAVVRANLRVRLILWAQCAADRMDPREYSSFHSWACRCLHRVCCLGLAMHRDPWKVLCTSLCAELSNLNEGLVGIFTKKYHIFM